MQYSNPGKKKHNFICVRKVDFMHVAVFSFFLFKKNVPTLIKSASFVNFDDNYLQMYLDLSIPYIKEVILLNC